MKRLYLLLIIPQFMAAAQSGVKKADSTEYQNYMEYCNTLVSDTVEQLGRATYKFVVYPKTDIVLGNGKVLRAGEPDYWWTDPLDTVWFPIICKDYKTGSVQPPPPVQSYTYEVKQVCLHRDHICRIKQRRATVKDFYEWWKTRK